VLIYAVNKAEGLSSDSVVQKLHTFFDRTVTDVGLRLRVTRYKQTRESSIKINSRSLHLGRFHIPRQCYSISIV